MVVVGRLSLLLSIAVENSAEREQKLVAFLLPSRGVILIWTRHFCIMLKRANVAHAERIINGIYLHFNVLNCVVRIAPAATTLYECSVIIWSKEQLKEDIK